MNIRPIEGSKVNPEYQELHELYCYFGEVTDTLLSKVRPYLNDPLFPELLGRYSGIRNDIGSLLILLQQHVAPENPALLKTWREACDAVNRGEAADPPRTVGA